MTIIATIKSLYVDFGVPLQDAKPLVALHPSWQSIANDSIDLQETAIRLIEAEGRGE